MARPGPCARPRDQTALAGIAMTIAVAGLGCAREPADAPGPGEDTPPSAPPNIEGLDGERVDPLAPNDRPDVLVFVRTDCPISNRYAPTLAALAAGWAAAPIDLWLVYVDPDEGPAQIREHVRAYALPGTPIRDPGQRLAARGQIRVTPEAAVFDASGALRYHGRIDDWYVDYGKARAAPRTAELREATEAVLDGRPVDAPRADAVGCPLPPLP